MLVLALTVLVIMNTKWRVPKPQVTGPVIGFCASAMVTGLAIGGPLLVLFLLGRGMDRQGVRASMAFLFTVMYCTAVAGYAIQGLITTERTLTDGRSHPRGGPRILALGASNRKDERPSVSSSGSHRHRSNEHTGPGTGDSRALTGYGEGGFPIPGPGRRQQSAAVLSFRAGDTLMNKLEFVDTHVHLYDMQHPELVYGHWQPSEPHPVIGWQIRKLAEKNYVAEDYIAETRNANVTKAVHVQAAFGNPDPVTETEWLQEAADRTGFPHGIVAHADLRDPGVERVLERHYESPNMRGIRDFSYGDYLVEPDYHRGFALLEKFNLVSSMPVEWQHMENLRALANKFPNIMIVVDHTAFPTERTDEYFENWKRGVAIAATSDNIRWKISGLGMADHKWTIDSIRPYVLTSIETMGVDRCFFATNWPVDWLFSTYDEVINAYTEIISDFTRDEQTALFSKTAEKLYRI